jgi:oligopeptide transport system substrate-binding protein
MAIALASGCTRRGKDLDVELADGTKAKLEHKDTLRINVSTEPPTLDWHKATDTTSSWITGNTMEGLVEYDLNDKELGLIPALATKWEPSENARKWKFTLREGVKWSDGQPFLAQHVLDGWKRLMARETASEYAYFLFALKNGKAFNEGKVPFEQVGAKITAPNVIEVELEKPMGYFPYLLTHSSTFPVRLDVVQKHGDRWTEAGNIVTLGPYTLKAWQHDKQILLQANDNYFGEKPFIKNIVAYMIQEQATAINLFDSGKLDSVHSLPSVELRKLRQRKEFRETSTLTLQYYGFNVSKAPFNNPLVRKAISMGIDRQQVVQMLAGGQLPMTSWIPSGMFGYEAERGLSFNPEKAKELMKQAGYGEGKPFPKIEFRFNTNEDHQRVAENIQAQLKKNLGIDMEIKNEEWKVFLNTLKTDPPQMFRMGWQADYPDPDNFMNLMTSYSEQNRTRWKNAQYDSLVEKAAGLTDKNERKAIYSQAQKLMVEDEVPAYPLYSGVNHLLISPRVEGYPVNVLNRFLYKRAKLKE